MFTQIRDDISLTQDYLKARLDITDETGATAVEYGLLVGALAAAIVAAMAILGPKIQAKLGGLL